MWLIAGGVLAVVAGLSELMPGVDLAFSDIRFQKMSVVVLNLRAPSVLLGYELGGIVGHRFLSRYHVSIDLTRAELRLKKS